MHPELAALEALLFVHGEPLSFKKIAGLLEISLEEAESLATSLKEKLSAEERGLALIADAGSIQLVTKPALAAVVQEFIKHELTEDLTPASLETLSLIAYLGPVSRARLDYLRGVNSSFILRNLMMRGLVERFPDPEKPAVMRYRAAIDLWKHLGVEGQEHLPEYAKFKAIGEAEEHAVP